MPEFKLHFNNNAKPAKIEFDGVRYDLIPEQPPAPPKPTMRRLTKEDVPELEKDLAETDEYIRTRTEGKHPARIALLRRTRAELFLCIECLNLGGDVFSKPRGEYWTPNFSRGKNVFVAESWTVNSTAGDFFFRERIDLNKFMENPLVIDALHEFYMIEKPDMGTNWLGAITSNHS